MSIDDQKERLVTLIKNIQEPEILDQLLFMVENIEAENRLSDREKMEIEQGIAQLDAGKGISLKAFIKRVS